MIAAFRQYPKKTSHPELEESVGKTRRVTAICALTAALLGLSAAPALADRHQTSERTFSELSLSGLTVPDRHQTFAPQLHGTAPA